MAVRIVTDSTADLPFNIAADNGITIIPLNVHFGEELFKDGVDIWSEEFYHRLRNEFLLPNTSQPSPGEFLEVYQKVAQPGDIIISLHISEEMSGTLGSARIAAEMVGPEYRVEVVDSRTVCMALGLLAIRAARLAKAGASANYILKQIAVWKEEVKIYFTVSSLEHLQRTGRIGKASAFLGTLLNIKPLLSVVDGVVSPVEKIRGNFQKVAQQMVDLLAERFGRQPLMVSILHSDLPETVQIVKGLAEAKLEIDELIITLVGPVVGSHAGPNTVGILALPANHE
jgi:DegV family protein with EDD domain